MVSPPVIVVQLVHLEGPFKGQIHEFTDTEISIGRHPECTLKFPAEATIISRKHAEIFREGNRFKIVDHSANGTAVNGKLIKEAYLKDGDVLTIAQGGPKISFLSRVSREEMVTPAPQAVPPQPAPQAVPQAVREPVPPPGPAQTPSPPSPQTPPSAKPPAMPAPQKVKAPLIIQFGPTLRSYKELPVNIGKNPRSDFCLDLPGILDQHAQIYFYDGQYWLKDLTGRRLLAVNRKNIETDTPLQPNDEIVLGPDGPAFQFLGGGRLAELEQQAKPEPSPAAPPTGNGAQGEQQAGGISQKAKSILKKYLHR